MSLSVQPIITNPTSNFCKIHNTQFNIEWSQQEQEIGDNITYNVYVDSVKHNVSPITDLIYQLTLTSVVDVQTTYNIMVVQKIDSMSDEDHSYFQEMNISVGYQQSQPILSQPQDELENQNPLSVNLSWTYDGFQQDDVTYNIYVDEVDATQLLISGVQSTNLSLNMLIISTTYFWKVAQVTCYSPEGIQSQQREFTTSPCTYQPSNFTLITPQHNITNVQVENLTFEWQTSIRQQTYDIYLKKYQDQEFTKIQEDIQTNTYEYGTDLDTDTVYIWKVTQKNYCGDTSSQDYMFRTNSCNSSPNSFSITSIDNLEINIPKNFNIQWSNQSATNGQVKKYQIFIGNDQESLDLIYETLEPDVLDYTYFGQLNTNYILKVRQINDCGVVDTSLVDFTTIQYESQPTLSLLYPQIEQVTDTNPVLVWQQNNWDYFNIYISSVSSDLEISDIIQSDYTLTEFQLTGLEQNTTYYWKIQQVNSYDSTTSDTQFFRTEQFTQQPTDLTLSYPQQSSVDVSLTPIFSWSQSDQSSYNLYIYKIQYNDQSNCSDTTDIELFQFENITDNSYQYSVELSNDFTDCTQNVVLPTHKWKVRQINNLGYIDSNISSFRILECSTYPQKPNLYAPQNNYIHILTDSIILSWIPTTGQTYYDLYFGTSETNLPLYEEDIQITSIVIDKNSLQIFTTYYWYIKQKNKCGISEKSDTFYFRTSSCLEVPNTPSLLQPFNYKQNVVKNDIEFTWTSVQNQISYKIYISTNPNVEIDDLYQENITTNSYICSLEQNTTYYWKIQQSNNCGISPYSNTFQFSTSYCEQCPDQFDLISPNNLQINQPNSVILKWEWSNGQNYYDIYLKKQQEQTYQVITSNNLYNDFIFRNLIQSQTYDWYVIQKNDCGFIQSSTINRFTVVKSDICQLPTIPTTPYPEDGQINIPTHLDLRWLKSKGKDPITYTIYLDKSNTPTQIVENDMYYNKQKINLYTKYTQNVEQKIVDDYIMFSSYNVSNNSNMALYPLIQPREGYKLSYEKYIYFKQDYIQTNTTITNLKFFNNILNNYYSGIELYYKNSIEFHEPTRQNELQLDKIELQNYSTTNNVKVGGVIGKTLNYLNNRTDYLVLQMKILPKIGHHSLKTGQFCFQYDEYIRDENLELNLQPKTTYYWRIEQSNECGQIDGPTWSFTTL